MSVTAEYELVVDWNDDGDFSDTGEDVSDDLRSFTVDRGFAGPLARVAGVGRANMVMNNLNKDYSPPAQADVLPRRPVRLNMTYDGTTETLFRGFLDQIAPQFGQYSARQATFQCTDAMPLLDTYDGEIALLTDCFADDIIDDVVSAVYTPPGTSYQAGINPFPTSAVYWNPAGAQPKRGYVEQAKASEKIEQVCVSDWGRFFIAGNGYPTYYNRHQVPLDDTTELTLDNTMLQMTYAKAIGTVYNYVEVTCYPRTVGQVYEVLGRLSQQSAPIIEANDSVTFTLHYRDPSNPSLRIAGKDMQTLSVGTDIEITSDQAGEGDDETSNVTISETFYGSKAEIRLTNTLSDPVWVQKLRVRGHAVRVREPVTVVAQDATSVSDYKQKRQLHIDAPLLSDPTAALLLAEYLLARFKDPIHQVMNVEILANKDATWMAAVRDLELLDLVEITEEQTGLSAFTGAIIAMQHNQVSRWEHRLRLTLEEPYTIAGTPFRIGVSALNSGHVLIY